MTDTPGQAVRGSGSPFPPRSISTFIVHRKGSSGRAISGPLSGLEGHPEGSRWGCCHRRPDKSTPSAGELLTQTLLVNGNGHVLVLVSIDSDDHLNSADDFATDNGSHFCLLKDSASARRADKTVKRLEVSCHEATAPMAVGAVSSISGSSRQIIWKASGPVSDLYACVVQFNSADYTAPQAGRGREHLHPLLHERAYRLPDGEGQGAGGRGNFTKLS